MRKDLLIRNKIYPLLPLLIFTFFCACQNSELKEVKSQLNEANDQIARLQEDNQRLNTQLDKLTVENQQQLEKTAKLLDDLYDLKLRNENITRKNYELANWTGKLRDGYGTGIWQTDDSIFPIFKRSMKSATVSEIIKELNKIYQENGLPKVVLKRIDGTNVYLTVDDSDQLTQRMGTSGASSYMKEVFLSITSVEGIECVDLDFKEGDHALPTEYCKQIPQH